jgi:hypothetical protein
MLDHGTPRPQPHADARRIQRACCSRLAAIAKITRPAAAALAVPALYQLAGIPALKG